MAPKRKSKKRSRKGESLPETLIDEEHREEIIETFNAALTNGKKTLSIADTKTSLKILGIDSKSDEIQNFLEKINHQEENVGNVDQSSYLQFAASKLIQIEKANQAFGLIDKDQKGVVVLEDLQRVAQELGEDLSQEELNEMIESVDRSGDGLLRPKDFVRIARKVHL